MVCGPYNLSRVGFFVVMSIFLILVFFPHRVWYCDIDGYSDCPFCSSGKIR